jgi:2,6-dihydroxypyridine 3-monooxygenase
MRTLVRWSNSTAAIVGGSIGGLTVGLLLRQLGFHVDIYERTEEELDGRGGGIVLQPETLRWFKEMSDQSPEQIATTSHVFRCISPTRGDIAFDEAVEWRFSSWSTLYRALLADFGREDYHLGFGVTDFSQNEDRVELSFSNGETRTADLVIFADGVGSIGRQKLLPEVQPEYSGYIGWRGTVPEGEMSAEALELLDDALGYCFGISSHICMYPIPGLRGEIGRGDRLMNYVWYQNVNEGTDLDEMMTDIDGFRGLISVPPGRVQQRFIDTMKEQVGSILAPAAAELVRKTEYPYIQAILDVRVPQMAFGRIAIMGDAAFVGRPHAAAGSAKAADDAWALFDTFNTTDSGIPEVLRAWEPGRLAVGNALIDRVVAMGRRAQFDNTWEPTDLNLRFGLTEGVLQPQY